MKHLKVYRIILVIGLMIIIGCSTDDSNNDSQSSTAQVEEAQSTAQNGTWRITNFNDSGQDETSDFNGYVFAFASNGTLTVTNGNNTITGSWSVTDDSNSSSDSSDDDGDSSSDVDFNIFFPVPESNDFEDLNDDWDINSISDTVIDLIDISGGNGGTDILTFERN